MDRAWWNEYGPALKVPAELWTTNREASRIYKINHIEGEPGNGIAKRPNGIRLGGNSGAQAVGLAIHFGAARVVLLGYDMQNRGKEKHWHGDHKRLGNPMPRKFPEWIDGLDVLGREAKAIGCTIVNASRETALTCFERVDLESCLA